MLKVLFIGGNGIISSACSQLAVERNLELTLLNRGRQTSRPPIDHVETLIGDSTDAQSVREAVGAKSFDVVVNFRAFTPEQAQADVDLFRDRTGQYIFISSASAYLKPVTRFPILESTPLKNPFWQYSRDKIACERVLMDAFEEDDFPVTIVRPSHTYDRTLVPLDGGWTAIARMRAGKPTLVHGDGTSLWTLTNHRDVARGLVGLMGLDRSVGDAIHITSDEILTWDMIANELAAAAGTTANIVHAASNAVARAFPEWADGILGDKAHSVIFDNSKIKSLVPDFVATVPFSLGAREIVDWYDDDPSRQAVDRELDARIDQFVDQQSIHY
ncbi:NAD-dependent epimerase/dehydratase family protein [Microbacterium sp. LWS13-1.2]|uniref:NAD-dependent epimerase/dehydratase family protein n=1 Tax=Microbacterium sp. LWS13-1.2 TaxID=3135264 RepID=A0AAU6SBN3_9MICO